MAEVIKAIVFGIIQGITEWLPISSTGHMILLDEVMPLQMDVAFVDSFFVIIQSSSILAVLILFFNKLWPFGSGKNNKDKRGVWALWSKIVVAALPAGVMGILFDDLIDQYLYRSQVVALALVLYGVLFLIIEEKSKKPSITKLEEINYRTALMIGAFQVLALVPGTSRSGATILGAVLLGCSRTIAAEFSFILAIPVMAGASLLKLVKAGFAFEALEWMVLIAGCLTAFVVSMASVKFLLAYVRRRGFKAFGYYRILLGFVVILYFWLSGRALA